VARLKATGNWHRGSEDHSSRAAIRPASARGTALL
jgi:hypothetical protein